MTHKKQSGFAALEGILILVIVGVIGFTGYYVWHSKQNTDKTLTSAAQGSVSASGSTKKSTAAKSTTAPAVTPAPDPYAGWQSLDHDGTKYVEAIGEGYGIHFSLKYPSGWQYVVVGTTVAPTGLSPAPAGYNQLVPTGKTKDDFNLEFNSEATSKDAQGYWNAWREPPGIPDVDNASQVIKTFTTTNGYSALTGTTNSGSDVQYSTLISNSKGIVIFIYHQPTSNQEADYNLIFNSVKLF